nr:hypothetical protein [Hassalia byssoidea]
MGEWGSGGQGGQGRQGRQRTTINYQLITNNQQPTTLQLSTIN